jgi:hypothetical protein
MSETQDSPDPADEIAMEPAGDPRSVGADPAAELHAGQEPSQPKD